MINASKTALDYITRHAPGADTPAPWDLDEDTTKWAVEWGEEAQNGVIEDLDGTFAVSLNFGEVVRYFGGLLEALAFAKTSFNTEV